MAQPSLWGGIFASGIQDSAALSTFAGGTFHTRLIRFLCILLALHCLTPPHSMPPLRADENQEGDQEGDQEEEQEADQTGSPTHFPSLHTDSNAESTLTFARELAEAGREPLAVDLLTPLLESETDVYVRDPAGEYRAAREEALRLLSTLSPDALAHYRLHADPRFLRIVGSLDAQRDETALRKATERYFPATQGDRAALLLAGLYMNRGAYRPAIRLLERILNHYPDSRIPPDALYLRLAIARAAVGDPAGAEAAWEKVGRPALPRGFTRQTFHAALQTLHPDAPSVSEPLATWGMPFGSPSRDGRQPAIVPSAGEPLTFAWTVTVPHKPVSHRNLFHHQEWPIFMEYLLQQLRIRDWRPTEQIFLDESHLYIHTFPSLFAFDRHTGERVWVQEAPAMHLPDHFNPGRIFPPEVWLPSDPRDIWSFGSRADKELLVHGDAVYRVENVFNVSLLQPVESHRAHPQGRPTGRPRSTRPVRSSLVALNRHTGAVRWRLEEVPSPLGTGLDPGGNGAPPAEPGDGRTQGGSGTKGDAADHLFRFTAAPFPFDDMLLLPVEEADGLSLLAVDAGTGDVRWRRTLCLYHANEAPPWQPVRILRSGADVYVASGLGLLFLLDGTTGGLHWVRQYPRAELHTRTTDIRRRGQAMRVGTHPDGSMHPAHVGGWEDNALFLDRNALVLVPSDAEAILGFDATTGALRWSVPQGEDRYVLGTHGHRLYVAGRFHLRCIDMQDGTELWAHPLPGSVGRGTMAGDQILLPVEGAVLSFDAVEGTPGAGIAVPMPPGVPVLNLATDGEYLFAAGLDRVWAFAPMSTYLPRLQARVEQGTRGALAARGLYLARNDRGEDAVGDLHAALEELPGDHPDRLEAARYLQRHYLALAEETGDESLLDKVHGISGGVDADSLRVQVRAAIHIRHGRLAEAVDAHVGYALGDPSLSDGASPAGAALHAHPDSPRYLRSRRAIAFAELEALRRRFPEGMDGARAAVAARRLRALREGVPDPVAFLTLASILPETDGGLEARHRAGRMLVREGYPELAQEAYRNCTGSADPRRRMAGTAFLADMAQMWGWEGDAARLWGDILLFHKDGTLPWLGREHSAHALARVALGGIQARAATVNGERPGTQPGVGDGGVPDGDAPPDALLWRRENVLSHLLLSRGRYPSQFRAGHSLLANPDTGHVECVRLRDGKRVWGIDVVRSEHHARQTGAGETAPLFLYPPHGDPFQALSQMPESHLFPIRMDGDIVTLGTVTGGFHETRPRYWVHRNEFNRIMNLHMRQGVVAYQYRHRETNEQWLSVLCSVTGAPLWSRMQPARSLGGILIGGDHILLMGSHGTGGEIRVVEPYRIEDGHLEGQVVVDGNETLIAFSDRGLLIDAGDAIRLQPYVHTRTGWRLPYPPGMRAPQWQLLPISENMTCLYSMDRGHVFMLHLDGTPAWSVTSADGETLAAIAFADDGTSVNVKWTKGRGRAHRLVQYDLHTGTVTGEAAIPDGAVFPLAVAGAGRWIPLLRQHPDHRQPSIVTNEVAFFDKRTGKVVSTIRVPRSMIQGMGRDEFYLGQNLWVHRADGLFIIDTQSGTLVYRVPPSSPKGTDDPDAEDALNAPDAPDAASEPDASDASDASSASDATQALQSIEFTELAQENGADESDGRDGQSE